MAQVRWTVGAADDLEEAVEFLSARSVASASDLVQRILSAVSGLEDLPHQGRIVPEYQMPSLRELVVRGFRVVYILDDAGESVRVYAIQHGSRDLRALLGDDPWEAI